MKHLVMGVVVGMSVGGVAWGVSQTVQNVAGCEIAGASAGDQAYFGGGTSILSNEPYNAGSGDDLMVVCPLTRHFVFNIEPYSAKIQVMDSYSGRDVECVFTIWGVTSNGTQTYDTTRALDTNGANANEPTWADPLYWQNGTDFSSDVSANDYERHSTQYGIYCTIPPKDSGGNRSGIGGIYLRERG